MGPDRDGICLNAYVEEAVVKLKESTVIKIGGEIVNP